MSEVSTVRLQKILSEMGLASRREAEAMIRAGEVTINGRIAQLGDKAQPGKDHIKVRGKLLQAAPEKVVIAVYKPRDVLSTGNAPDGRPAISSFMKRIREKVFPIGRLDTDAEGLLLLTNDGTLAQRLASPKYEVPKVYIVKIDGHLDEKRIKRLSFGVEVEGHKTKPARVQQIKDREGKEWLEVTVTDARNRIVRKMFEAVGRPVDKVRRISFAGISLKGLDRGEFRYLTPIEIGRLRHWVGLGSTPA